MTLSVEAGPLAPEGLTAVGVPVAGADADTLSVLGDLGRLGAGMAEAALALLPSQPDVDWLRRQGFRAKRGQTCVLRSAAGGPSVVLLGLGPAPAEAEAWRLAAAGLVRSAGEGGHGALLVPDDLPDGIDPASLGAALAEGAVLAAYRFGAYRSTPKPAPLERVTVVSGSDALALGVRRGIAAAQAVAFARDLINTPPSDMPPRILAERAADALSGLPGTTVDVWDEERIVAERLGGVLTVSRGSAEPPRLVVATYDPPGGVDGARRGDGVPHVVLVGKGITFDSGGLSLKTADGMTTMKTDMSGAAIVLGALSACAALGVAVKVTAIAPMAENMPDGRAVKPGDVFTARNGATIEVLNTDAEGRLILADGLSLATELQPSAIVDVATLTGAARVALGTGVAPLLGTHEGLVAAVRAAGARAGERFWPMPIPEDYLDHIDSEVADMKNTGRGEAGVIAAAALLSKFVGEVPWAHLDIAGTGRSSEESGYLAKGGTAFGLRTLLELLASFEAPEPVGAG